MPPLLEALFVWLEQVHGDLFAVTAVIAIIWATSEVIVGYPERPAQALWTWGAWLLFVINAVFACLVLAASLTLVPVVPGAHVTQQDDLVHQGSQGEAVGADRRDRRPPRDHCLPQLGRHVQIVADARRSRHAFRRVVVVVDDEQLQHGASPPDEQVLGVQVAVGEATRVHDFDGVGQRDV